MITPISALKAATSPEVHLPPFSEDSEFIARLRRPSMMSLVESGVIPNTLLSTAQNLFTGKISDAASTDSTSNLKELTQVLKAIAKASLMEPTYEELQSEGIELTDEQLIYIFNYSQTGVDSLKSFREEYKNTVSPQAIGAVSQETE